MDEYIQQHDLENVFKSILVECLRTKPADPIEFTAKYLVRKRETGSQGQKKIKITHELAHEMAIPRSICPSYICVRPQIKALT